MLKSNVSVLALLISMPPQNREMLSVTLILDVSTPSPWTSNGAPALIYLPEQFADAKYYILAS